jgi:TPR repeat protein
MNLAWVVAGVIFGGFPTASWADFAAGVAALKTHDYAAAFVEFKSEADNHNAKAQNLVGEMYMTGLGVGKNATEAANWFHKAAEQGVPAAQRSLGLMYSKGDGVAPDYERAYFWLSVLARNGDKDDILLRDGISHNLKPDQIAKVKQEAQQWRPKQDTIKP